jgi:glycine cleavage system H lipoate-binding protein
MRCPFLREEQVKSCRAAPFRMSLARSITRVADERCTSPDHAGCPTLADSREAHPSPGRCPFLQESLVQFCAASPVTTYVPWSSSPELRCGGDGHRYCELFLASAGPRGRGPAGTPTVAEEAETANVDGVSVPGWLFYAPNHMWLDIGDEGMCHVGIDDFLVQVVGGVERLAFLAVKGVCRPAVVLTAHGVDVTLVFAHPLRLVAANTRLRADPSRLTSDPYGAGWLFEGRCPERRRGGREVSVLPEPGLRQGAAARDWMADEVHRVTRFAHERLLSGREPLPADGGRFADDLLDHLEKEEALRLLAELFPLPIDDGRSS